TATITIPVLDDAAIESPETFSVVLSAAQVVGSTEPVVITNTTGAATILSNDTETFSLTQTSTSVNEGRADTYTVHLSNPIDPGVPVSVNIAIALPGGLGGAEAADFANAFLADIDAAIASTTGVTRSGTTLTFDSTFNTSAGFSFTLPTVNDTL